MVAVAIGFAGGHKVVLAPVAAFKALGQLQLARAKAAQRHAGLAVVAALAGDDVGIASDVVQAIARVVGAAHNLDGFDVQREDGIQKRHAARVVVAGDAVDQQLDGVDPALAVEAAHRETTGVRALLELRDLHAGGAGEQLPAVVHMLVLQHAGAQDVHRAEHIAHIERARGGRLHGDGAQRECGVVGRFGGNGLGPGRSSERGDGGAHGDSDEGAGRPCRARKTHAQGKIRRHGWQRVHNAPPARHTCTRPTPPTPAAPPGSLQARNKAGPHGRAVSGSAQKESDQERRTAGEPSACRMHPKVRPL